MKYDVPGRTGTFRTVSTIVLLLALAFLSGCAATTSKAPAYLPDEAKAQLGTVGVASARFTPGVEFQTPATRALDAAGRRAANWAGKAAEAVGKGDCIGPSCLVILGILIGGTIGGALAGGISGAVDALPADTVREAEAALTRSLSELRLQEELRDRVFQVARQKTLHPVVILADHGPSSPDEPTTYDAVASQGVDSILEISLLTIGLAGDWDINPPLKLAITGRTRLVRVLDGTEIHATPFGYTSGARLFTEWAVNEAQPFRAELDRALHKVAEEIVGKYFLLLPPELDSPSGVAVEPSNAFRFQFLPPARWRQLATDA